LIQSEQREVNTLTVTTSFDFVYVNVGIRYLKGKIYLLHLIKTNFVMHERKSTQHQFCTVKNVNIFHEILIIIKESLKERYRYNVLHRYFTKIF